ncbi:MAG: recombination regulator RecX [Gammaproteobacteria bacterium]
MYPALRETAFRLLARREHSAWELRRKLLAKLAGMNGRRDSADDGEIAGIADIAEIADAADIAGTADIAEAARLLDDVLRDLAQAGAQSDWRFAEQLCRLRYESGRGPRKLRAELRQHRIDAAVMDAVMAEYAGKWRGLAARVRRKKFGARAPGSHGEWEKQAKFLEQRGFAEEEIETFAG